MTPLAPIHAPPTCFFPDVCGGEGGDPVQAIRETPPPARRGFTQADQVNLLVSASEADADLGFMTRMLVLCRLGVFFVLTFALLTQSAWGQRIGPLGPTDRQQAKASTERAAAVRPPSLQLSLTVTRRGCSTAVGSRRFAAFATARGPAPPHRRPPSVASEGAVTRSFSGGARQDNRRGSVAINRGRTPLASEDDLSQRPRYAHSLSGLRHRGGQPLAPLGETGRSSGPIPARVCTGTETSGAASFSATA